MPQAMAIRRAEDWRGARTARRYELTTVITPVNTAAAANILGLRQVAGNPDVHISAIRLHVFMAGISNAAVVGWKRASSVAGGTLMTTSDTPEIDSVADTATLEVRSGTTPTGTKANQYMLTHAAPIPAAPAASVGAGWVDDWAARDLSERIHLRADEGMILDWVTTGNTNTRFYLTLVWEEIA